MYSEADLESAISAGVLSADNAAALRTYVAQNNQVSAADEEQFRLITGFNDIFVAIACALVIFAASALGKSLGFGLSGLFTAVACWIMAEFFTRKRHMALPSILLLLGFVIGVGQFIGDQAGFLMPKHTTVIANVFLDNGVPLTNEERFPWQSAIQFGSSGLAAALAAFFHWRRFHVPITIAAGVGAAIMLVFAPLIALFHEKSDLETILIPIALVCGLATFAFAMRWDLADLERRTIKSDVAFWLHLLAAPLIAHPLFTWLGVMGGGQLNPLVAIGVLAIYLVFAVVALAIDRRALLVSALAYVLVALARLFDQFGAVQLSVALTTLVIGSALLMLSAFWAPIRAVVLAKLPSAITAKLPHAMTHRST